MSFPSHILLLAFGMFFTEIGASPSTSLDPPYFHGISRLAGTAGYTELLIPIIRDLNRYHSGGRRLENKQNLGTRCGRLRVLGKRTSKEASNEGRVKPNY